MLYSSGTTGRPKGVKRPLPKYTPSDPDPAVLGGKVVYGWGEDTIYLSPAPMYHAAPLAFSMNVQRFGGTVVIMEHFDAAEAIAAHRAPPGHALAVGADDVRAHAEAARRGAPRSRPVEPPRRDPRGRAVPGRGEAPDHRVVGSDPARVLRRHRRQRRHVHRERGLARSIRARSDGSRSASCTSSTRKATTSRRTPRARSTSPAPGSSSTTTPPRRPKAHACPVDARRSATSATSTTTATCSSPTARRT